MKDLKYDLRGWNSAYGELQDIEYSIDFYRTSYQEEIPKKELEANLISLEAWEEYAYNNKLLIHVTAFMANEQPYSDILFNDGNVIIQFIDEFNRIYMAYSFMEQENENRLFLTSLHYYLYRDDKFYRMGDSIKDVQYVFTPEGKITVWERYIEDGNWVEEAKEAAQPVNVENNWEPYPELGNYDSIARMKRWDDGDLLKDIPGLG